MLRHDAPVSKGEYFEVDLFVEGYHARVQPVHCCETGEVIEDDDVEWKYSVIIGGYIAHVRVSSPKMIQRFMLGICNGEIGPMKVGFYLNETGPYRCDGLGNFINPSRKLLEYCPVTEELRLAQAQAILDMESEELEEYLPTTPELLMEQANNIALDEIEPEYYVT